MSPAPGVWKGKPEIAFHRVLHQAPDIPIVVCAYCPPGRSAKSYSLLHSSIERVMSLRSTFRNVYILGDFNAQIDWSDPLTPVPQDPASDSFLETRASSGFIQLCTEPTYASPAGGTSYLDLCFTLDSTLVRECAISVGLSSSDHCAIHLTTSTSVPPRGPHARLVHSYSNLDSVHL